MGICLYHIKKQTFSHENKLSSKITQKFGEKTLFTKTLLFLGLFFVLKWLAK